MRRQDRKLVGLTLAILSAVAVAAAAQDRPAPPAPAPPAPRERAFTFSFDGEGGRTFATVRRGRLGVLVDLTSDAGRDSAGARIAGVTPGGPADRAGVRTDDIVLRINGTRLVGGAAAGNARRETDGQQSAPGLRLIEIASSLDEGDTVRLDLRRDNRPLTVTFQAGQSDVDVMVRQFGGDRMAFAVPQLHDELQNLLPRVGAMSPGRVAVRIGGPLADLELVKVNPGLAEYFGTSEGLLVVDAPSDSSLNLRAGDVILGIGGRRPASPAQALRILGTYEPGENVSFEVMRQKRRVTVNGKMPAADRSWRIQRNSFESPEGPEMRMMRVPQGGVMRIMM
jgi:S1-C subfamily serine protease